MKEVSKALKYDLQVPRYTSYPTAPHFSNEIANNDYINWLKSARNKNISLYLHIPFCQKLCWYCGCHTKITRRYSPIEEYTHLLKREIRLIADLIDDSNQVSNIHFGGGSPTILSPEDFSLIMQEIKKHFRLKDDAEIAIEIDPRNANEAKISSYKKEGVNRASIGVQDFHKDVQEAVNRQQPFFTIYDTVKLLRSYGINNINMDLIYGLPKQNLEKMKENISYTMLFEPDRIALFGYAHVPWMKKHMRLINEKDLPNSKERLDMFLESSKQLEKNDYAAIGIDHFVKKTDSIYEALKEKELKRNFQGYTTDSSELLIGLGISSISKTPQGYVQNTSNNKEYESAILNKQLPIVKGYEFSDEDKIRQEIIENIMCYLEVDMDAICKKYKLDITYFKNEILSLEDLVIDELIHIDDKVIKVNKETRHMARLAASRFDQYYFESKSRHSKVG